jgi:hypothetical protein
MEPLPSPSPSPSPTPEPIRYGARVESVIFSGEGILYNNSESEGNSTQDDNFGPNNPFTDVEGDLDIPVVMVAVPASAAGCCFFFFFRCCARRRRREEYEELIRHRCSTANIQSSRRYNDSKARAKTHSLPHSKTGITTETSRREFL